MQDALTRNGVVFLPGGGGGDPEEPPKTDGFLISCRLLDLKQPSPNCPLKIGATLGPL